MPPALSPDILFPAYGTQLDQLGRDMGIPDFRDPLRVLDDELYRGVNLQIALRAIHHGATVATTDTFFARELLRDGRGKLYRDVVRAHHALISAAIRRARPVVKKLLIALGPYGVKNGGCYSPAEAPDAETARDFHMEQLAALEGLRFDAALFETVCTAREAEGVALAAQRSRINAIISFVVLPDGRLREGSSLDETIRRVDELSEGKIAFGVNCSSLPGTESALRSCNGTAGRVTVIYPNASDRDPLTLEDAPASVSEQSPSDRARLTLNLVGRYPGIHTVGACCGSNHDHVHALANAASAH